MSESATRSVTAAPEQPARSDAADPAISVRDLWKVFGPKAGAVPGSPELCGADPPRADRPHRLHRRRARRRLRRRPGRGVRGDGPVRLRASRRWCGCLTRLIEPTAGQVRVRRRGHHWRRTTERLRELRRQQVSMVFQHFGLLPHRKVVDNVAYGLEVRGAGKAERTQAGRGDGRAGRPDRLRELLPRPALRRHAAAGRAGPGAGRRPGRAALRRAVLRARPADPPGHAERGHPAAPRGRQDDGLHHPRPGRGAQAGRPDPDHARRRDRPGRARRDEVVGAPADDYVRDFVSDVPRSHVLTLRWVMRPPRPGEPDGRARAAPGRDRPRGRPGGARRARPVRVVDERRSCVGVVDDEEILGSSSAEETP